MKTQKFAKDIIEYTTYEIEHDLLENNILPAKINIDEYVKKIKTIMINKYENTSLYDGNDTGDYCYMKNGNDDVYSDEFYQVAIKSTIQAYTEVMDNDKN